METVRKLFDVIISEIVRCEIDSNKVRYLTQSFGAASGSSAIFVGNGGFSAADWVGNEGEKATEKL
jgi:hypothetical protein